MGWVGEAFVPGVEASKGSKTMLPMAGHPGRHVMVDSDKVLGKWAKAMKAEMKKCKPPELLDTTILVVVTVYRQRPRSHYGTGRNAGKLKPNAPLRSKIGKDIDKVARAVFDCATGIWWLDDSRSAVLLVERRFADPHPEGVLVRAREILDIEELPDLIG